MQCCDSVQLYSVIKRVEVKFLKMYSSKGCEPLYVYSRLTFRVEELWDPGIQNPINAMIQCCTVLYKGFKFSSSKCSVVNCVHRHAVYLFCGVLAGY